MRLRARLDRLEAYAALRPAPEDDASRVALGDYRAVELAIAYDRRAREDRGVRPMPWAGMADLAGVAAGDLAMMFNERVAALRAGAKRCAA